MLEQGSPEWFALRLGKVTASCISDVVAKSKDKKDWGVTRAKYAKKLAIERITGRPAEAFKSEAMERGTKLESEARSAYEFTCDVDVALIDFVPHPTITMAGASPDGLVGDDGLVEIKCPGSDAHADYLLDEMMMPKKYRDQIQWQLACTGRKWVDWISYDPSFSMSDCSNLQLHRRRVYRDDDAIAYFEKEVPLFLNEVDVIEEKLRNRSKMPAA